MNSNKDKIKVIKVFEAFAGIGSQFKALKNIARSKNWEIQHSGMVEWFVDAIVSYVAIHSKNFNPKIERLDRDILSISNDSKMPISEYGIKKINNTIKASYLNYAKKHFNNLFDIKKVNKDNFPKNIDIFTYSFPCQDLSVQGLQKGIDKELNTRSGLLWEIERILEEIKNSFSKEEMPKYLLMENVKNLLSHKNKKNYNTWLKQLEKFGYKSKTYLLNSKNFDNCQNRERVFCLSIRDDYLEKTGFKFKELEKVKNPPKKIKDILVDSSNYKYLNLNKYETTTFRETKSNIISRPLKNYTTFNSENYVYNINGIGPTLTASGANSRIKIETQQGVRYLTPLECFKYMQFDVNDFKKVQSTNLISENKMIYIAGNSIPVKILEAIFNTLEFVNNEELEHHHHHH
uniref:Cytosine-specific methyltransferase n=2 Tax=Malacoplasma penetrans (strain HF-2) TaxID=272633 RepID=UPI00029DD2B0|nr:Chain A, Cytosine-specific methyltransferase [Malacoplasma penetrans HF-2]